MSLYEGLPKIFLVAFAQIVEEKRPEVAPRGQCWMAPLFEHMTYLETPVPVPPSVVNLPVMQHQFSPKNHYIRLEIYPPISNALSLRKAIQDAIQQAFGATLSATYVDILWISEDGSQCVARTREDDVSKILAALTAWSNAPRLSLIKESPFLPSLLSKHPAL